MLDMLANCSLILSMQILKDYKIRANLVDPAMDGTNICEYIFILLDNASNWP